MSILKTIYLQHLNGANANMTLDSSGRVGIGNNSPSFPLHVGGEIFSGRTDSSAEGGQISLGRASDNFAHYNIDCYGGSTTPSLRFIDAAVGAVRMQIDSNGNVTKPYLPAFHVSYPNSTTLRQSELIFTGTSGAGRFNTGGYYSTSTGRFTAPVAGRYMFMFTLRADSTNNYFHPKFVVNGSAYENGQMIWGGALDYKSCCSSVIYSLAAGDWVSVRTNESANDTGSLSAQAQCTFSGYLIG